MNQANAHVRKYVDFFEQLDRASLERLDELFSEDATFQDPFNAVSGRRAIRRVFDHMFQATQSPRFRILDWMASGQSAFIRWHFTCTMRGRRVEALGVSHVTFDAHGLATAHIDYWNPAQAIYEQLPVLGRIIRLIRLRNAV